MTLATRIEADLTNIYAQVAEARELLEKAPESVRSKFIDAILKCVAALSFKAENVTPDPAGEASGLMVFRVSFGSDFDRLMAALRAKKFDLTDVHGSCLSS